MRGHEREPARQADDPERRVAELKQWVLAWRRGDLGARDRRWCANGGRRAGAARRARFGWWRGCFGWWRGCFGWWRGCFGWWRGCFGRWRGRRVRSGGGTLGGHYSCQQVDPRGRGKRPHSERCDRHYGSLRPTQRAVGIRLPATKIPRRPRRGR